MSVMRRLLKNEFLLLVLLAIASGIPGVMLVVGAPVRAQSVTQTNQSNEYMTVHHVSANQCAPHQGCTHMSGASCAGTVGCSMTALPPTVVAMVFPQCGIRPVGPDRHVGRWLAGPDIRPPIVHS